MQLHLHAPIIQTRTHNSNLFPIHNAAGRPSVHVAARTIIVSLKLIIHALLQLHGVVYNAAGGPSYSCTPGSCSCTHPQYYYQSPSTAALSRSRI